MKKILISIFLTILLSSCFNKETEKQEGFSNSWAFIEETIVDNSWTIVSTWNLAIPETVSKQTTNSNITKDETVKSDTSVKQDIDEMDKEVQELTDKLFNDLSTMVEDEK